MDRNRSAWPKRAYIIGFIVLTSLCWCPWAYGTVTGRTLSIPTWAVLAYVFAVALVALEWVFLFGSGLALNDEDLPRILSELEAVGGEKPASAKEDR